jgi:hypothetical protein
MTSVACDTTQPSISNQNPAYYKLMDILNENANPYLDIKDRINFLTLFLDTIETNIQKYSKGYVLCNVNWIDAETAKFVPENASLEIKENQQRIVYKDLTLPSNYASVRVFRESQQCQLSPEQEQKAVLINVSVMIIKLFPNTSKDYPTMMELVRKIPQSNTLQDAKVLLSKVEI